MLSQEDAKTEYDKLVENLGPPPKMATAVSPSSPQDEILSQRGPIYGPFITNADVSQQLKEVFYASQNWNIMPPDAKEAFDIGALKMSRILTGTDVEYLDNWDDLSNYFRLVADRIRRSNAARNEPKKTRDDRFEGAKNAG